MFHFHLFPDQFVLVSFLGILAWAAARDAVTFEIPDAASLTLAALYPIHVLASPRPIDLIGAIVIAIGVFVCGFFMFVRGYLGGGDVKLLSASALWAGPQFILPLLLTMSLSGGVLAALIWSRHRFHQTSAPVGVASGPIARAPLPIQYGPYGIAFAAGAGLIGLWRSCRLFRPQVPVNAEDAAFTKSPLRLPYGVAIAAGASLVGLRLLMG